MDWLTDLLKHLRLSRAAVVAVFIGATIQYFGARYYPAVVESPPSGWGVAVFLAMVITGSLLLIWGLAAVWASTLPPLRQLQHFFRARSLTEEEEGLLRAMARDPRNSLNVDRLDYDEFPLAKIELLSLLRSLVRKGLVDRNQFASELYILSEAGERRALELLRSKDRAV